MLTYLFKTTVT